MAKTATRRRFSTTSLNELNKVFEETQAKKRPPAQRHAYAVRMTHGPKDAPEISPLVILATDPVDAHRQWFNHHGLHEQTHRYRLAVVKLDPSANADLIKTAIRCEYPRVEGSLNLEEQLRQQIEDEQKQMGPGAAVG